MTNTPQTTSARKRLLLIATLLGCAVLAGIWVAVFLARFDLNDYRQDAEEHLSALLSVPVQIEGAHYNLQNTKLALHLTGVRIGDTAAPLEVLAPDIIIELQWRGLLARKIRFSSIILKDPTVWLRRHESNTDLVGDPPTSSRVGPVDPAILASTTIKQLVFNNAALHFEERSTEGTQRALHLTSIHGRLDNIGMERAALLSLHGNLQLGDQQQVSAWQLDGETTLVASDLGAPIAYADLALQASELDLSALRKLFPAIGDSLALAGKGDLRLALKGTPGEAVAVQLELSSQQMSVVPTPLYANPIPFHSLRANGTLEIDAGQVTINDLAMQLDQAHLAGQVAWQRAPGAFSVTATLSNGRAPITQVRQWLPDRGEPWQTIRAHLQESGTVDIESVRFSVAEDTQRNQEWHIEALAGRLEGVRWALSSGRDMEITSLPLSLDKDSWRLEESLVRLGSLAITASGAGRYGEQGVLVEGLDLSGTINPATLLREWNLVQEPLTTEGTVALRGHIAGAHTQLTVDLQADLSQLQLTHPAGLNLTPSPSDSLSLHGTLTPGTLSLDHGAIKWSLAKGHITGHYPFAAPEETTFEALLSIDDLSRLGATLPLLSKLALRGQADLSVAWQGPLEGPPPEMILTLREAGLHATDQIADIQKINGRVKLTPNGLQGKNLQLHLGASPLTVDLQLTDYTNPRLELEVRSNAVRARDVIFKSEKALLRDLAGHLEISREGLTFAPVDVRLDGGTDANVQGFIGFSPPYPVRLDIASNFALLSEVIGLWTERPETAGEPDPVPAESFEPPRPFVPITINARVSSGDLYGMRFQNATGVIRPTRERLIIHPLDFSVGEGYCNAQVLVDFPEGEPVQLRISGHAEDVDALEVYRELLNQKSIVRGKLRGDFHLTGQTGKNYIPTTNGQFSVRIRDGVLHQFQVLSKVFSLLNISQIFALQLPDMDREGMPFDSLTADFRLEEGVLRSDNLVIQSRAMNQSYQGQMNLATKEIDLAIAMHPLGTVDKIISRIPVAGWLLTGEDQALLTAHFTATGTADDVAVNLMPLDTLTEPTIGLLRRTLGLPFKLLEKPEILWGGQGDDAPKAAE